MMISNYIKMNYAELGQEINKQKKKIESAKETIRLLEKLQIAENAKQKPQNHPIANSVQGENNGSL